MMTAEELAKVKEHVEKSKSILILTHGNHTMDNIGSALSMYLGLTSLEKSVSVVSPGPMTVEFSSFVAADKLRTALGNKNFVITLDYEEGSIEKVSYNIDSGKFNLVIEPRVGFKQFDPSTVSYSYQGVEADLIIAIDVRNIGEFGELYEREKHLFADKPIINIDHHDGNTLFGSVNIVDASVCSTVEIVALVLSSLGVHLTKDIATNILNALYDATESFQIPTITGRTFEVAAVCVKAGGIRFPKREEGAVHDIPVQPIQQPVQQSAPPSPPQKEEAVAPQAQSVKAPEEWLKPKIFKTSHQ